MSLSPWANNLCENNEINFDDPIKNPVVQYSKSKLAQLMYVNHLARLLRQDNSNTIVTAVFPGYIPYELDDYIPHQYRKVFNIFFKMFGKNVWQSAQTCIHLSLKDFSNDNNHANGKLFVDCRQNDIFTPKLAKNSVACQKLWDKTEEMLGL